MLREVHGTGNLTPIEIRWIPTLIAGRVERIHVLPGTAVKSDTPLVELSNPELEQQLFDAEWACRAAEAELENLKVQLESQRLNQESATASIRHEGTQADLEAQADEELEKAGLVPKLVSRRSRAKADELKGRLRIEEKRLAISADAAAAQIAVQQAKVEQLRAQAVLKKQQVQSLTVRAGIDGVLQKLGEKEPLQAGQQLPPGANVALVANPARLKAEIRVPETQAKDIQLGQLAVIDSRNGVAEGRVARIDPAAQNGTVLVDVEFIDALPKGARPDLTVEGTIQLERLDDVVNVGKPVQGQPETTVGLYKLSPEGKQAMRVSVKLGRGSVNTVEILEGLQPGDRVILSDMSQWDSHERIRIRIN
jgi:HlyD family secretion protein